MNPVVIFDEVAGAVAAAESRGDGRAHILEEFYGWLDRVDA